MIMVSMTAVTCVREHTVLDLAIADPIPAAFGHVRFRVLSKDRIDWENQGNRLCIPDIQVA